jgi:uncharacterized protein (DUF849 family)
VELREEGTIGDDALALARGHGIRTGLEDMPVLPDGRLAG